MATSLPFEQFTGEKLNNEPLTASFDQRLSALLMCSKTHDKDSRYTTIKQFANLSRKGLGLWITSRPVLARYESVPPAFYVCVIKQYDIPKMGLIRRTSPGIFLPRHQIQVSG
jgi:hypothetical protein